MSRFALVAAFAVCLFAPLAAPAQDLGYSLVPGNDPETLRFLVHNDMSVNLDDWIFQLCRTDPLSQVVSVSLGEAGQALNGGNGPELYLPFIDNATDCPLDVFAIISLSCVQSLPVGDCLELNVVTYSGPDSFFVGEASFADCWAGNVYYAVEMPSPCGNGEPTFVRGDADGNGSFNGLIDGLFTLNAIFAGGFPPPCADAADFDDSGSINLTDGFGMLNYQYAGGPPPVGGFECSPDPTDDSFECDGSTCP